MRKVDYQHLARVIDDERRRVASVEWFEHESDRARTLDALRRVADRFARGASVDRAAFVRACGFDA